MNVTLRKAKALELSMQDAIRSIKVEATVQVNEFEPFRDRLIKASDLVMANDTRRHALLKAQYKVRSNVGKCNATSGINDRLAEAAYVDKRITMISDILVSGAVESDVVLEGKLNKIRNRKEDSASFRYGLGEDGVTTGVLAESVRKHFELEVKELRKRKQRLNDEILELNIRTQFELDAESVNLLLQEGLT
jgi:vacuolar-type H+-ATPase subunit I/STV1